MRILVTYATAGAGHKKCAQAIFDSLKDSACGRVYIADCLDYTYPVFKFIYSKGYAFLVSRLPFLWNCFFKLTDNPAFFSLTGSLRRAGNIFAARGFVNYLRREKFDCCICTQFFANEIISDLKARGILKTRLVCVITDYSVHHYWLAGGVDTYTVACRETKQKLLGLGVDENKIKITGIPVHPKFLSESNRQELQSRLGLDPGLFTVMIMTGAFGMGPIEKIVKRLQDRFQVLAVCGNNLGLFARLNRLKNRNCRVYGMVNNIDELMSVADLAITKPGGLTVSEALVKNLPMLFISAIPGQEEYNARLMAAYQIAEMGKTPENIVDAVERLSRDRQALADMKANTRRLGRPSAAREIVELVNG